MNTAITEIVPDNLVLQITAAVRDGRITWLQGESLKAYIENGKREIASDLLKAWSPNEI